MDAEERTELLMKVGYLLTINNNMWVGSVTPYPEDLGVGVRVLPMAMPTMCVMSKPWMKKVLLLRGSLKRSLGMMMSHGVYFEGGPSRYVLGGAAQAVADSLDESSLKMTAYYNEAANNMGEVHRISRQIISKNSDHIWRTVSHLFPEHRDKLVAPEEWKGKMLESVMSKRFPSEERLRNMRITYSIYRTTDTYEVFGGKRQRPYPGLIKDCSNLSRALQEHAGEMEQRLISRVTPLTTDYKSKGLYTVTVNHLRRDLLRLRAYNPVPLEGYDLEGRLVKLEAALDMIDMKAFQLRKEYRQNVVDEVMETIKFISGSWRQDRAEKYLELFGPIS